MRFNLIEKSNGIWKDTPHSNLLYYLLVVILCGLICSYIVGGLYCLLMYDVSFFSSSQVVFNPDDEVFLSAMKSMQFFNALGTFVLPPVAFLHLRGLSLNEYLKLDRAISFSTAILLFVMAIAMIPTANFLGALNEGISLPEFLSFLEDAEAQTIKITESFLQMDSILDLFAMLFLMGLVAAVGEELLFRGVLQNLFKEWSGSIHISVVLTALLFSAIHMQYQAVLPRFVLGALIGYLYVYSGSLRAPILLHLLYNSSLVVLTYFMQQNDTYVEAETIGEGQWFMFVFSMILLFGALYLINTKMIKANK